MPEASARRLRHDDDESTPPRSLRVVRDGDAALDRKEALRRSERMTPAPAPGRPHPRSRLHSEDPAGARVLAENAARVAAAGAPRTIVVTGQSRAGARASRDLGTAERRRGAAGTERTVERPDRLALWAVGLGLVLAFMAAATAQADVPAPTAAVGAVAQR
ncbi:MAG: hypothetical protein ACR2LY_06085 [Thermoleophilaceae bacterium]